MSQKIKSRIAWIVLTSLSLSGCTATKYVPVETVKTDFETVREVRIDTVMSSDTVMIVERGDTVLQTSTRWRWRVREVHDTVCVERTDSVAVPYPVERKLTRWERTKQDWGGMAIVLTAVVLCAVVAWLARKFRLRKRQSR